MKKIYFFPFKHRKKMIKTFIKLEDDGDNLKWMTDIPIERIYINTEGD